MTATDRSRGEWAGATALALVATGIGIGSPLLVAAAAVPMAYLFATFLGTEPPATVRVHRRFALGDGRVATDGAGAAASTDAEFTGSEPWYGRPGDTLTVRTTIRNAGPETIVDLRVSDGVPAGLPVVDGTTGTCVTLKPGAETTLEYDVALRRGEHEFADPTVRVRDYTGTIARTCEPAVAGDREIRCSPSVGEVPLDEGRHGNAGQVPTDEGGRGVEFHAVREYETGDPIGAIDWRRYANTRDLATVEYRTERSTRIVCLVDARPSQFRELSETDRPAIELTLDAVERTVGRLTAVGHPTGVVGFHSEQVTTVSPGTDTGTRRRVRELLDAIRDSEPPVVERESRPVNVYAKVDGDDHQPHPYRNTTSKTETVVRTRTDTSSLVVSEGPYSLTETDDPVATVPTAIPGETLVYLFSSFVDDTPVDVVEGLRSRGYAVRVISPDVTGDTGTASRLDALARETRLSDVRATGTWTADWNPDRPLELVLEEALGPGGRR